MNKRARLVSEVEAAIDKRSPRRQGGEICFLCPMHDDHNPSARWNIEKQVWFRDVCDIGGGMNHLAKLLGISVEAEGEGGTTILKTDAHTHITGLTLDQYATAKKLPLEFLRSIGVSEIPNYNGGPAVKIEYARPDDGPEVVRFRTSLEGPDRFKWRKGSKPIPYGLDHQKIASARDAGYIMIVEGESDAQTCWLHGIPCVGIPGSSQFKRLLNEFAQYLVGIDRIYVVIEPDRGGETVMEQLVKCTSRDRIWTMTLGEFKDISDIHRTHRDTFNQLVHGFRQLAIKWTDHEASEKKVRRKELWDECEGLARDPNILNRVGEIVSELGVAGESRNVKLLYLILTSRLLPTIVNAVLKGPSSSGKSFVLSAVMELFPDSATYALSGMSERAMAYGEEDLSHRFLVMYEAAGVGHEFSDYLLRSLLSEGEIRYELVEKTSEGLRPRTIHRSGPTGFITTTTATSLHPENETRLLTLTTTDTPEQTRQILIREAEQNRRTPDLNPFVTFQEWLECGSAEVDVPYATSLAASIPEAAIGVVRIRRDFPTVLNLIRVSALIHQYFRTDDEGPVVACRCDYEIVRELVLDVVSTGLEVSVSKTVRETVSVVAELQAQGSDSVTVLTLSNKLGIGRNAAGRRAKVALSAGYLSDGGTKSPKRYTVGEPMPSEVLVLPDADDLGLVCTCASQSTGSLPPSPINLVDDNSNDDWFSLGAS